MKNILVVCTGNICRSPTGEYLLKKELGEGFNVMSAGLGALVDHPAHEISQKIALEHGIDMSAHHARQINLDILKWADLILVMENGHKKELLYSILGLGTKSTVTARPSRSIFPTPTAGPKMHLCWLGILSLN